MKTSTKFFALALLAVAIGVLFCPLNLFATPPLPDDPGAVQFLDAATVLNLDMLNPEFPAAPESDGSDLSDVSDVVPAPAVAMDDAFARTLVWAGAPGAAATNAVEAAPVYEFYMPAWLAKLGGLAKKASPWAAAALAGWYSGERLDLWEKDSPAPSTPSTLPSDAIASAPPAAVESGEVVHLLIVGSFLGPVQVSERGQYTPGLTFQQGTPGRSGEITAFLPSDGSNRQGGGTWRATYGNEIVINVPDGAYAGLARVQGANILLSSGITLRPTAGASITVSQP